MYYNAHEPSATTIGLLTHTNPGSLSHKYPRTYRILRSLSVYQVKNPDQIAHPAGTTHHGALFELGHPKQGYEIPDFLTPKMLRHLGEIFYRTRKHPATIHVFGVLDTSSPLGSYALLESLIRRLIEKKRQVVVHAAAWSPTPREFRHNYHNLKSMSQREEMILGSVFPAEMLRSRKQTERYIDGLQEKSNRNLTLPLHESCILSPIELSEHDIFLSLLPPSRERESLDQAIEDTFPLQFKSTLPYDYHPDQAIKKTLAQSKHILGVANDNSYIDAYFGTELTHPYFESIIVSSPIELLEMLISPHFGYAVPPHRTTVLIDAQNGDLFDWLLASYVRKQMTKPFLFHPVTGNQLHGARAYSNRFSSGNDWLTHQDLHWYGT